MTFYSQLLSKKREWTPAPLSPNQMIMEGAEGTVARAIALRGLEIPVGDWALETSERERDKLGRDALNLLADNAKDEEKHDVALNYAWKSIAPKNLIGSKEEKEAAELVKAWKEQANRLHPVVVAGFLETSIFFVILPLLRKFGGAGLQTVANDISRDEYLHTACNNQICKDLGHGWDSPLDILREDTIEFIVKDLDAPGRFGLPKVWHKSSRELARRGQAPALEDTGNYVSLAFFEIDNRDLPVYY